MTPTREQYELAAKAAGGTLYYDTELVVRFIPPGTPPQFNVLSLPQWRPHEDRADAFSLLCALPRPGLDVEKETVCVWYARFSDDKVRQGPTVDVVADNIEAAAREAIFLCAVEVGRGMA